MECRRCIVGMWLGSSWCRSRLQGCACWLPPPGPFRTSGSPLKASRSMWPLLAPLRCSPALPCPALPCNCSAGVLRGKFYFGSTRWASMCSSFLHVGASVLGSVLQPCTLPCPALPCPALPCPALPCPTLLFALPALPCFYHHLPWNALSFFCKPAGSINTKLA